MLFAFRSMSYSSSLSYIHDKNYIRGRVVSVSVKDDKVQLIIRNNESGPARVLVTLNPKAAERSELQSGSYGYIGMMVEARGEYAELSPAEDPGCFDYALYMKSKGVTIKFKA